MTDRPSRSAQLDDVFSLVYDELRTLAGSYVRRRPDAAVAPTSIVHEAFLRLRGSRTPWTGREHFCAIAATAMRQILIDRARRRRASKRGGDWERVTLVDVPIDGRSGDGRGVDMAALDDALTKLEGLDARQARVVELRVFGGLTLPEIANDLGVSASTVEKEWRRARAWLACALADAA